MFFSGLEAIKVTGCLTVIFFGAGEEYREVLIPHLKAFHVHEPTLV